MLREKYNLREKPTEHGFVSSLETYILDRRDNEPARPMVIVCPGGGYARVCEDWEGERVAVAYNAVGFCAATLDYSVAPHRYPDALLDVAAAIKLCREKAEEWQVDPHKIIVLGFSAAGHLAADISNEWNNGEVFGKEAVDSRIYRPDLTVLCYPVITSGAGRHEGSFVNLTGSNNPADWSSHSVETLVGDDTPPAFIWHTFEDSCVPVVNSLLYAEALRSHKIPFELHIYEKGDHGLSLATQAACRNKPSRGRKYNWFECSVDWIEEKFGM